MRYVLYNTRLGGFLVKFRPLPVRDENGVLTASVEPVLKWDPYWDDTGRTGDCVLTGSSPDELETRLNLVAEWLGVEPGTGPFKDFTTLGLAGSVTTVSDGFALPA